MPFETCPENLRETCDAYLEGRLAAAETHDFEDHYLGCPRCSDELQFTDKYVCAFRRAGQRMRPVLAKTAS